VTSHKRPAARDQKANPHFSYYLYSNPTPVDSNHAVWRQPLPLSRHFSGKKDEISISYADYFGAVRIFFENRGLEILSRAVTRTLQQTVTPEDIREIRIRLEKHGEFYHPARIEVPVGQQSIFLVLNVAVSATGLRTINEEYRSLKRLNDGFPLSFLPKVYGFGEVVTGGNRKLSMFLAQWFQGYNEFHLSKDLSDNSEKISVWDEAGSRFFLSAEQQAEICRQAAKILAYYYNVETFEQIFAWHHAAGDFVLRIDSNVVDLKLVTVRRYAPLLQDLNRPENGDKGPETILQALLLFFLGLSIRMRLDRLDGVGDITWADARVVPAILEGFFEGLTLKPQIPELPEAIDQCFGYYLSVCSQEDLFELTAAVANEFDPRSAETPIVRQHLKEHVDSLYRSLELFLHKYRAFVQNITSR
jgi:hypothetical protein